MKNCYLLGAGAALAVALGCAEANAQFAWLGGPYPVTWYVGPEGGWTSLSNQKDTITTVPFRVDTGVVIPPNGPYFNKFNGSARYDTGFNAGGGLGFQYGPLRLEEEYSYRHNGISSFGAFFGPNSNTLFQGQRNTNAIMTNFIYDFGTLLFNWPFTPHVGFGIGALENVDSISLNPVTLGGLPRTTVSGPGQTVLGVIGATSPFPNPTLGGTFLKGSQWNFGYQAIV